MAKQTKKHRTSHGAEADENGKVYVFCETCYWRDVVDVSGLTYMDAIMAIFKARDEHEANPNPPAPPPSR